MKPDMSDLLDTKATFLKDAKGNKVGYEGVNIFEKNGIYYLMAAEWNAEGPKRGHIYRNTNLIRRQADGRYDAMIATAENLMGPYSESYLAIPHAGHNMIFEDHDGNLWSTMFGNDEAGAPFREDPALLPLLIDDEGKIRPKLPHPVLPPEDAQVIYVSKNGNNHKGDSWENAYTSINQAIESASPRTQIWVQNGEYSEKLLIKNKKAIWLYGGFDGDETSRTMRDTSDANVIIDVKSKGSRAAEIVNSEYIRIEGFTFTGGTNHDKNSNGGGLYIQGGGEHVVIVNSLVKDNYAAGNGGGVYITDGASPLFIGTQFEKNLALNNGGAVAINANDYNGYHTRFYNSILDDNEARVDGGAIYANTKHMRTGTVRIINSVISNNKTVLNCGNVCLRGGSVLLMVNSVAYKNVGMSNSVSFAKLGHIPAQHRLVNNIFMGNKGGALIQADGFAKTMNTITEVIPKKADLKKTGWVNLVNNAFYDNQVLGLTERTFDTQRRKSAAKINELFGSQGNMDENPMFVAPEQGDFRLKAESTLIDKGSAESGFPLDIQGNLRYPEFFSQQNVPISLGIYQHSNW